MGTEKVQTGVVGGHGFLPFFLLDAFFRRSLTGPKLKKPRKVPDLVPLVPFPPHTKTVISLFIHSMSMGECIDAMLNSKELMGQRGDVT